MRREDGFTLIEALVALMLGAVLVTTVLSAVRLGVDANMRSSEAASRAEALARAGAIISGDTLHALVLRAPEGPLFEGRQRSVAFAALPRSYDGADPAGQVLLLRYDIRPRADGDEVLRSEAPLGKDGRPRAFGPPVPIWRAPGSAEFRYLDTRGRWVPTWDDTAAIPRALAVSTPGDNGIPRLAGQFLDLVEPDCAFGPGDACSLPYEAFQ